MKPSHMLFTCCILWLCQQQIVFSSECSANGLDKNKCSKTNQKPSMVEITESVKVIVQAGLLIHSLDRNGHLDIHNVKFLLQHIEKYPHIMSFLGVGISVVLLKQSLSDMDSVNRIKKEYYFIHATDPSIFVTLDAYLKFVNTRSSEIRNQIVALKTDLQYKGILKSAFAVGTSMIAFTTNSLPLQIGMLTAAGGSGLAAIIEFHNCYELKELLTQLDQGDYIP